MEKKHLSTFMVKYFCTVDLLLNLVTPLQKNRKVTAVIRRKQALQALSGDPPIGTDRHEKYWVMGFVCERMVWHSS